MKNFLRFIVALGLLAFALVGCLQSSVGDENTEDDTGSISLTLLSPDNNETEQDFSVDFSWNSNADRYDVYLGTNLANLKKVASNITSTVYTANDLEGETTYLWQIVAKKNGLSDVSSGVRMFTTKEDIKVSLLYPEEGDKTAPSVSLSWDGNADGYYVWFGENSAALKNLGYVTGTTFEKKGLKYATTYYWQIVAVKDGYDNLFSEIKSFSTKDELFVSLADYQEVFTSQGIKVNLSWEGNADKYDVYFGTDENSIDQKIPQTSEKKYTSDLLDYNTTYYWKVVATKYEYEDVESSVSHFVTSGELEVSLDSPANNAIDQDLSVDLTWDGNAESYIVYFGTSSDNLNEKIAVSGAESYTKNNLENEKTYFWKVEAKRGEQSTFSDVRSFTTEDAPRLAYLSPAADATEQDLSVDLAWSSNGDSYKLYFGKLGNMDIIGNGLTDTIFNKADLKNSTDYYWKVDVIRGNDLLEGDLQHFKTKDVLTVSLISPAADTVNQNLSVNLNWDGNGKSYDVYFGEDSENLKEISSEQKTKFLLKDDLDYEKTYYWEVVANRGNETAKSGVQSFKTKENIKVSLSSPLDKATGQNLSVDLIWDGTGSSYEVWFGTSADNLSKKTATITEKNCSITGLAYDSTYYWKVITKKDGFDDVSSGVRSFTTKENIKVSLTSPEKNATDQNLSVDLRWTSTGSSYEVWFGTSADNLSKKTATSIEEYEITNLAYSTTYYWKVITKEEGFDDVESSVRSFTTKENIKVSLTSPANKATGQNLSVDLSWDGTGSSYEVWFGTSAESLSNKATTTDKNYLITGLDYDSTYYWKVVAKRGDETRESGINSFTTKEELVVSLTSPADSATEQNLSVDLTWNGNADSYDVYFGEDSENLKEISSGQKTKFLSKDDLDYEKTYYWEVVANRGNETAKSGVQSFKTKENIKVSLTSPEENATGQNLSVDLIWDGTGSSYEVWFGTSAANLSKKTATTDKNYLITGLAYDSTYYWKVITKKDGFDDVSSGVRSFTTKEELAVSLSSPVENAINQNLSVNLTWTSNGDSYTVFFGTDSTSLGEEINDLSGKNYVKSLLAYSKTYYWKVVAKRGDEMRESGINSFTTKEELVVSLTSPADSATEQNLSVDLTWNGNADSYDVYFGEDSNNLDKISSSHAAEVLIKGDLDYSTTYYWKVVAKKSGYVDVESGVQSFTTKAKLAVSLVSPADSAAEQNLTVNLFWSGNGYSYDIYMGKDASNLISVANGLTSSEYQAKGLEYETTYYWKVVTKRGDETEETEIQSFTTKDNIKVSLTSPEENATGQNLSVDLSWTGSGDNYSVFISKDNSNWEKAASGLTGNSWTKSGLAYNTKYYWKVITKKDGFADVSSSVRSFTTKEELVVSLGGPDNDATGQNLKVELSWTSNGDSYDVYFGTSEGSLSVAAAGLTVDSFIKTDLECSTKYYWKVEVKRGDDRLVSETKSFTTEAATFTNSLNMDFVVVEADSFEMGSEEGNNKSKPVHTVLISKDYYMGKHEVTVGQVVELFNWAKRNGVEGLSFSTDLVMYGENKLLTLDYHQPKIGYDAGSDSLYVIGDNENYPINYVSCYGADAFVEFLNMKESTDRYRLPTEAQWEFAARGGTKSESTLYSGDEALIKCGWYKTSSDNKTHPVGGLLPNELGIYDMSGNVFELCRDIYSPAYYFNSPKLDPTGPETGTERVVRGGGYSKLESYCTVYYRSGLDFSLDYDVIGFRISSSH